MMSINTKAELCCLIVHPDMDPCSVTEELSLQPHLVQRAGDRVVTPKGREVAELYKVSKWSYKIDVSGSDELQREFSVLLDKLTGRQDFVRSIYEGKGRVSVFFNFSHPEHIYFNLTAEMLSKLNLMKVNFGFEIF